MPLEQVKVEVVVMENGEKVDHRAISYYAGQEYAVLLTTPDGVDRECYYKVGKGPNMSEASFRSRVVTSINQVG